MRHELARHLSARVPKRSFCVRSVNAELSAHRFGARLALRFVIAAPAAGSPPTRMPIQVVADEGPAWALSCRNLDIQASRAVLRDDGVVAGLARARLGMALPSRRGDFERAVHFVERCLEASGIRVECVRATLPPSALVCD